MRYSLKIFDSKNTFFVDEIEMKSLKNAIQYVKQYSLNKPYPIILQHEGNWIKFEKGEKTEWSITPIL